MDSNKKQHEKLKNDYIECFENCLDLFIKDSIEYKKLKNCIKKLQELE